MFTVVIAEQEHIDNFKEYALFLKPFIDKTQFALCQWNRTETRSLKEIVPELESVVNHREEWRAIVLCDESGIGKKNPFQQVDYCPPILEDPLYHRDRDVLQVTEEEEAGLTEQDLTERMRGVLQQYFDQRWEAKKAAYDAAAQQPLVRLVTMLCEDPTVTSKGEQKAEMQASGFSDIEVLQLEKQDYREEFEYVEYRKSALYRQQLRAEIRQEDHRAFASPMEILCIARRHYKDMDRELECVWTDHDEREYSRFYDWNLYFDKMRYLVFDIEDKNQLSYWSDYIRFLTAVCVLAANMEPSGCLQPHRVYSLICEQDEQNICKMLVRYFAKLDATKTVIQEKIQQVREADADKISDEVVTRVFCHNITIPVDISLNYKKEDLFSNQKVGLSADCPVDSEETVWMSGYDKNRRAVRKLIKQPDRAVKHAVDMFRTLTVVYDDRAASLTEFQADDIREYVNQEELQMVDFGTNSIYDTKQYYDRMEEAQREVHNEMEHRMRRFPTVMWGVLTLLMVMLGMIPTFIANLESSEAIIRIAQLMSIVLLVLVFTGVVCLLVYRMYLKQRMDSYNNVMSGILQQIESDAESYSKYLSHACNFMRGDSILSYYQDHKDGDFHQTRKLQKHIIDIDQRKKEVADIYGSFLVDCDMDIREQESPYEYDFDLEKEFSYPIQPMPDLQERIEFLQKGNWVEVPYGIIRGMQLRREELYD